MTADLHIDFGEVLDLKKILDGLPSDIRKKAMYRAFRRITKRGETQLVRRAAQKVNLQQRYVREAMTTRMLQKQFGQEIEFFVKAGWVPLIDMGPIQDERGVSVKFPKVRGSFKQAWLGKLRGRDAVLQRAEDGGSGKLVGRYPIRELHAANVAHAIQKDEDYFERVLTDIVREHLEPRILHEIQQLLREKG